MHFQVNLVLLALGNIALKFISLIKRKTFL
jgi:hypothetical protein